MSAREKIEGLTNSYYGYAVFCSAVALWHNGIGFFSLFFGAIGFVFSILFTWFIGRRLLAKASLTRTLLVVLTAIISVLGTIGFAKMSLMFFQSMSLSLLFTLGFNAIGLYMNVKAFRVLTDKSVKAYFA